MKKALSFLIILLTIGATVESAQTEKEIEESYRQLQEKRRNEQLEKMRYNRLLERVKEIKERRFSGRQLQAASLTGAATSIATGMAAIPVGVEKGADDSTILGTSLLGGMVAGGITAGLAIAAIKGYKWWQVKRINAVLKKYLNTTLKTLNDKQAALILSAYDKNKGDLQFLLSRNSELNEFINQKGVLEVLAHFYFGKSNQSTIMKMKQIIK